MATREEFLEKVRHAVTAGNRRSGSAGINAADRGRGDVGYQGGGPDLAVRFCTELASAGGTALRFADIPGARAAVLELVRERSVSKALLGMGEIINSLGLAEAFGQAGVGVTKVEDLDEANALEAFFAADLGITGADYLIAETGSVVSLSRSEEPRSASLLPPVHIVVASVKQLLPDLFDLFERLPAVTTALPACVSIITGPSKTGDIELKLVTGVHGPGELHVVLVG